MSQALADAAAAAKVLHDSDVEVDLQKSVKGGCGSQAEEAAVRDGLETQLSEAHANTALMQARFDKV